MTGILFLTRIRPHYGELNSVTLAARSYALLPPKHSQFAVFEVKGVFWPVDWYWSGKDKSVHNDSTCFVCVCWWWCDQNEGGDLERMQILFQLRNWDLSGQCYARVNVWSWAGVFQGLVNSKAVHRDFDLKLFTNCCTFYLIKWTIIVAIPQTRATMVRIFPSIICRPFL